MRTKMKCTAVVKDKANHQLVGLTAVGLATDNAAHPDSQISLRIPDEKDHDHFIPGNTYFVDFSLAEEAKKPETKAAAATA